MGRNIVAVEPQFDGRLAITLRSATSAIPNAQTRHEFLCTPEQLAQTARQGPSWVQLYGHTLWERLGQHEAISLALENALTAPAGQMVPIYFELADAQSERFYWETLCNDQGTFLALDARWPICRIPSRYTEFSAERKFQPPLRLLGILSAFQVGAEREWEGLEQAVLDNIDGTFPLRLHIMVSERNLYNLIKPLAGVDVRDRPLGNNGRSWLSVSLVPDRTTDLLNEMSSYQPHVLHLFCHGTAALGQPQIEIATPLDWEDTRRPRAPLLINVDMLSNCPVFSEHLWLATLNCCESGAPTEQVHSLVAQLVVNGLPAAVGMREPVELDTATEFSRTFYAVLIQHLAPLLASLNTAGQRATVDWGKLLCGPRGALSQQYGDSPSEHGEWTLPVLYVAPNEIQIVREAAAPTAADATLEGALRVLPPTATPPQVVRSLLEAMEGDPPDEREGEQLADDPEE